MIVNRQRLAPFCLLLLAMLMGPAQLQAQQASDLPKSDLSEQLNSIQASLNTKIGERNVLRQQLQSAAPDALPELQIELDELNEELKSLRENFEQLAIGTIDMDVFNDEATTFDLKEEITQIMLPIMENLKDLTEKPRKLEQLRSRIELKTEQQNAIVAAIAALERNRSESLSVDSSSSIDSLLTEWQDRQSQISQELDLTKVQLTRLETSDKSWWRSTIGSIGSFITGRGLTLAIAALAGTVVWFVTRWLLNFLKTRSRQQDRKTQRTRKRLANYAFKLLSGLFILITVISVFYTRGDMLLLGLSFLVVASLILGLRNMIPNFLAETRLLLNFGSVREGERVIYNGLPFQVVSLNMFSVLRNPELSGVIRLPLESLRSMVSRPARTESWFPASKNDYILYPDGRLRQVMSQTPERVELSDWAGVVTTVPSTEFNTSRFDNLTRGENFCVSQTFGIGYTHQEISLEKIPQTLQAALETNMAASDLSADVVSVGAQFVSAGESSLDYWVGVTVKSSAAASYFKIRGIIQRTCVEVCSRENWDIPFPHLTLHQS